MVDIDELKSEGVLRGYISRCITTLGFLVCGMERRAARRGRVAFGMGDFIIHFV